MVRKGCVKTVTHPFYLDAIITDCFFRFTYNVFLKYNLNYLFDMNKLKCLMLFVAVTLTLASCHKAVEVSFDGSTQEIGSQGGSMEVALKSNGEWTLSSSADWLVVTPLSGNGDATLTLTAEPNTGSDARTAEITAATKDNTTTLTVTQLGPQYYLNVTPREIRCGSEGGEFDIAVSSNIDWTVSLPQWITSSVTQGSNDATVTLTVAAVGGDFGDSRDVEVVFGNLLASDRVHVVQTVDPVMGIEVSPLNLSFVCTGETKTVTVTTEDSWTASTLVDWVTLSQTEGQGNAQVSVTVGENPLYTERQASVAFQTAGGAHATLILRQEASPDPHFLEVSPLSFHFVKDGGEKQITIGCDAEWMFDLESSWLSVSPSSGTGNATVTLVAEPNLVIEPRSMEFIIKSGSLSYTLSVTQEAGNEQVEAAFVTDTLFVTATGGLRQVELTSNASWTLEASDWITLVVTSGEGNASFDIIVNSNSNPEERIGFVNIIHGSLVLDALVVVQEGRQDILEVDIAEMDVRPEGGEFIVHVTSNQSWTVGSDVDWAHYNPTGGFGNKDVTITIDPMPGLSPRTGHVKFSGSSGNEVTVTISQH